MPRERASSSERHRQGLARPNGSDSGSPYRRPSRSQRRRVSVISRPPKNGPTNFHNELLRLPPNWDTGLPQDSGVTREELAFIVSTFFRSKCQWHKVVYPQLFLRDLRAALASAESGTLPQKDYASPMLYNSIVAYSLGYSEVEGHRSVGYRSRFASEAKKYFDAECQAPTLATVQALAILSSFHSGVAEQGLSFTYLGIAFTVSRTLCLDGENSSQYSNNLEKNHFSFVLWNLFCLDKTCSLYVGRRQNLRPFVTESTYWKISSLTEVGMIRGLFNPITPVLPEDEAFVAHVGLMQIASFIMEFFYSDDGLCRPGIDIAHVEQLSTLIETWNIHLPASLRGDTDDPETILSVEVIMIKLIFEWMKILLYQPFFQDSTSVTFTSPSFNQYGVSGDIYNRISTLCTRAKLCAPPAAFKITSLLETFDRQYGLRIIDSAAVQIAYVAGRMHLLGAIHNPDHRYGGATPGQGVIRCIDILRKIGETWPSGIVSADRLDDLYRPVHDPREDEVGRMDAGSPPPYPSSK